MSTPDPLVGTAQAVSGDGWSAAIMVGDHVTRRESYLFTGLLVPVTVDVVSGSAPVAPVSWKVHTLSGKTVAGTTAGSVSTAIGDRSVDRDVDGLIPFPRISNSDLADDVSITEVALYAPPADHDPIT